MKNEQWRMKKIKIANRNSVYCI